jgi:antitoxin HicB
VPTLPSLVTQGDTLDQALAMARDAIALYLEDLVANGEPIPRNASTRSWPRSASRPSYRRTYLPGG